MNRLISAKPFVAAAIALGAIGAASAAHARSDVFFSVGIQPGGYGYVEPAPVYVQPQPVYVQPQPLYYGRQGYYDDRATYVYERDHRRHWRHARRFGPWGDIDRDGVPNRYDRFPQNPYRR